MIEPRVVTFKQQGREMSLDVTRIAAMTRPLPNDTFFRLHLVGDGGVLNVRASEFERLYRSWSYYVGNERE